MNGPRLANQALNSKSSSDDSSAAIDWENQFISDRVIKTNNEHNHYSASESANPINGELSNDRAVNKPLGRTGEQKRNVEHSEHNGEQSSKQNDQKNDQKNGKKNSQPNGDRNGHQTAKRTSEQGVQPGSPQSAEVSQQPSSNQQPNDQSSDQSSDQSNHRINLQAKPFDPAQSLTSSSVSSSVFSSASQPVRSKVAPHLDSHMNPAVDPHAHSRMDRRVDSPIDSFIDPHSDSRVDSPIHSNIAIDSHINAHEANQYSLQPGNRIKELHQRSLADLAANLESEPQFRKKRDFEQSTSRRGLSTGEPIESADLNRPAAFESADDSSLAAVHNSNDEAPRGSTEQDASNGSSGPNGSSGSTGSQPNGPTQTTDRKPAQLRLKEKLRNFVIKNKDRLMKSRFISQMPNCGQRICAILETLQMSTYYVSTLTMAGRKKVAFNSFEPCN